MSETFGTRLKKSRQEKGITQKELSAILHVSLSTVSMWENDKNIMDIKIAAEISDILDVSVDYLLGIEKGDGLPQFIKQKLGKLENIEAKDLKSQLYEISSKLKSIADEL